MWLIEVGRGVASRLTFNSSNDGFPLWFPNGRSIVFGSEPKGTYDLVVKSLSDGDDEQPLLITGEPKAPSGVVARWQVPAGISTLHPKMRVDLWALPMTGERKPFPVVQTPFDETAGQLSSDGKWVAYRVE